METQAIYTFFDSLRDDSLSFLYHGFISDEFTSKIISLSESNIDKLQESKGTRNKISVLIAESFQNIVRHGEYSDPSHSSFSRPGIFIFRIVGHTYVISSANLVRNENIDRIKTKVAQVNALNEDEIKALYSEVINNNEFSEKGGAGLGLIEMARKTGNKLEFEFEKINDQFSFFYIQLILRSKGQSDETPKSFPITVSKDFYDIMDQNNTYLTYKGDFSQENIVTLLKIIERNLQINPFEHQSVKSLIYLVLTELFQNISKHSYNKTSNKEGLFLLGRSSNQYVLSTGNYILNNKIESFKQMIDDLNQLSKDDLALLYLKKLRSGNIDLDGNAGLGFIEIAKDCGQISYKITPIDDTFSFLNIKINI